MKQFVIIFRQGPRTLSDADKARRQEEVSAWARMQNAAGHKLEPRILAPEVLRPGTESRAGSDVWPISALLFFEAGDLAWQKSPKLILRSATAQISKSGPWAPPAVSQAVLNLGTPFSVAEERNFSGKVVLQPGTKQATRQHCGDCR